MTSKTATLDFIELGRLKQAYLVLLSLMGITGMAQMPIFKRYYIADIPGLNWLAQFYVTHYLHYVGAILLLSLFIYIGTVYLFVLRRRFRLTRTGYFRIGLLLGIVVTGIFRMLKNLPDLFFSPGFTMFIDISHLGFMMLLVIVGSVSLVTKNGWLRVKK